MAIPLARRPDIDVFFQECDPERENLCLYGARPAARPPAAPRISGKLRKAAGGVGLTLETNAGEPDGSWKVDLPEEEVPPELPEPVLGINFARDGMQRCAALARPTRREEWPLTGFPPPNPPPALPASRKDWVALIAVHSDAWLMAVAFYYGAKLDKEGRLQMFQKMNGVPTLYQQVTGKKPATAGKQPQAKKRKMETNDVKARASKEPLPTGRKLKEGDISVNLKGRQAELYWPDDNLWYLVEIQNVNLRSKKATIAYTTGEVEELDLPEIIKDGHMSLITK